MRLREQRGRPPVEVAPLQLDLLESLQHHGERLLLRRRARRGRGAHRPAVACRGYRHDLQLGEAVGEGRLRRLRIRLRGRGGRARQQQQSACWQRRLVRAARAPLRIRELARRSGRRMTAALAPPRKRSARRSPRRVAAAQQQHAAARTHRRALARARRRVVAGAVLSAATAAALGALELAPPPAGVEHMQVVEARRRVATSEHVDAPPAGAGEHRGGAVAGAGPRHGAGSVDHAPRQLLDVQQPERRHRRVARRAGPADQQHARAARTRSAVAARRRHAARRVCDLPATRRVGPRRARLRQPTQREAPDVHLQRASGGGVPPHHPQAVGADGGRVGATRRRRWARQRRRRPRHGLRVEDRSVAQRAAPAVASEDDRKAAVRAHGVPPSLLGRRAANGRLGPDAAQQVEHTDARRKPAGVCPSAIDEQPRANHHARVSVPRRRALLRQPRPTPDGQAPQSALRRLTVGGWTRLAEQGAPARYRHACVVVGARLLVYGGRANSGRLAASICVLDLLSGVWSEPTIGGAAPEQRWGHTMCAYRGLAIVFGGHRGRGSLCDTPVLDTCESTRAQSH
mmetsp:Transcript_8325/g.27524  ORF Transcript_8325/g.27524 Transcript_8325/m.27524 type:complete len:573 (-) Transcript_8325:1508-3226(-)